MKLKGLHFVDIFEIQEAVTDELKRVQKEKFLAAFQKVYDSAKACIQYMPLELILNLKKKRYMSSFFKKNQS
jgi:NADPH-dependent 7-cyano-7-deazaguanine reductase QueF